MGTMFSETNVSDRLGPGTRRLLRIIGSRRPEEIVARARREYYVERAAVGIALEATSEGMSALTAAHKSHTRRSAPEAVRRALAGSTTDWRTLPSLAKETDLSIETVRLALQALDGEVRNPVGASGPEVSYYRLRNRGYTREEWRRYVWMAVRRRMT